MDFRFGDIRIAVILLAHFRKISIARVIYVAFAKYTALKLGVRRAGFGFQLLLIVAM